MSDGDFPVFSGGTLQGNLTGNQGQAPVSIGPDIVTDFGSGGGLNPLPTLGSSFAPSSTSPGNAVTSLGGSNAGASAVQSPLNLVPSNAAAGSQPAAASGTASGSLADYFFRGVIIVLGFIFVAIGLNMFRPGTVPVPGIPGRK